MGFEKFNEIKSSIKEISHEKDVFNPDARIKIDNNESKTVEKLDTSTSSFDIDKRLTETEKSKEVDNAQEFRDQFKDPQERLQFNEYLTAYKNDIIKASEFPITLRGLNFDYTKFEKLSPEEVKLRRKDFEDHKAELRKQWSEINGKAWPTYQKEVLDENGNKVMKTFNYDAHHLQPICLGGKNEASNITPLRPEEHKKIHAVDSNYSKIESIATKISQTV